MCDRDRVSDTRLSTWSSGRLFSWNLFLSGHVSFSPVGRSASADRQVPVNFPPVAEKLPPLDVDERDYEPSSVNLFAEMGRRRCFLPELHRRALIGGLLLFSVSPPCTSVRKKKEGKMIALRRTGASLACRISRVHKNKSGGRKRVVEVG